MTKLPTYDELAYRVQSLEAQVKALELDIRELRYYELWCIGMSRAGNRMAFRLRNDENAHDEIESWYHATEQMHDKHAALWMAHQHIRTLELAGQTLVDAVKVLEPETIKPILIKMANDALAAWDKVVKDD